MMCCWLFDWYPMVTQRVIIHSIGCSVSADFMGLLKYRLYVSVNNLNKVCRKKISVIYNNDNI